MLVQSPSKNNYGKYDPEEVNNFDLGITVNNTRTIKTVKNRTIEELETYPYIASHNYEEITKPNIGIDPRNLISKKMKKYLKTNFIQKSLKK